MREGRTAPESTPSEEGGGPKDEHASGPSFLRSDADLASALLENDCDWFWESDARHLLSYLSEGYAAATGLDPARLLGRSRLELLLRGGQPGGGRSYFEDLTARRPFRDFVYEMQGAREACRWVSISGIPRFDAEGRFAGYRGTARNVTASFSMIDEARRELSLREKACAEAEEARIRLQAAIDALEDGFALWGKDDRLVAYNSAFACQFSFLSGLRPGISFREMFLECAYSGEVEGARGREEEWVERRIASRQTDLGKDVEFRTIDGRWMVRRELDTAAGDRVGIRADITEYKQRECELADAKRRAETVLEDLHRSLDAMSLGVVVFDADLNVEIVNKAYYETWNIPAGADTIGKPLRVLMELNRHNGVYDVDDEAWEDYVASRTEEIRRGDVPPREFKRADGRTLIYSVTSLSGGKRLVSYYDVTTLKDREAQLADALEDAKLARAVIDGVSSPIFVKDAQLNFVMVNQAFADFFGKRSDEMVERRAAHFASPQDTADFEESERQVLATGEIFEREEDFEFDGVECTRIVRKHRVRTSSGKVYVAGSIFDVTEMKRRETDSQEARTYLAAVLESLPAGIIIYDSDDRFVLANRKLQDTLPALTPVWSPGCTFREAVELGHRLGYFRFSGDPKVDALYDSDEEVWTEAYMARHRLSHSTFERRNPDGRWYQAIDTRMADGSFIGIRIDITELKEREAELEEAQRKAVLADRAKSEFLANMSHEIRTPMNGVLGMAELLARSELDDRQKTFTDIIVKSGNALLTIINDILDFSKIDAGQLVLDPAPFQLAEAIEDVATLVSTRAKEKDLELIVRVQPGLHDHYVGDVGRIRQIITNLLGNAVKFTDAGHVLVDVTGEDAGDRTTIQVSVTDTGIGIPQDKLASVFDKFSQVDASSTRRHEGTGLGLAITSRLVEMMGGEIGARSREGEGSTFWFTIMLPRAGTSRKERTMPIDVSGARILVIDDNAVNRAILQEQMQNWGFDACAASSGAEGIAVMKAVAAHGLMLDCVILDYQMPGMTGGEVARIVRDTPGIASTPIVMLTSVDQTLGQPAYRTLGIDAHLIKPARSSALLEAIVSTIQRHRGNAVAAAPEARQEIETRVPEARPRPAPHRDGGEHRVDILVAEDNEVNQLVFTQILGETGFAYEIVGNGRLAVEARRTMNPRMILMDVSMPEMNGLEATAKIREAEALGGGHVPIVGVTAHALKGDRERCLEAGMDDYLSKPISPEALTRKIRRWIHGEAEDGRKAG